MTRFVLVSVLFFLAGMAPSLLHGRAWNFSTTDGWFQTTPARDTVKEFEIIRGPSMRMIQTDTGTLQIIAGGAIVHHEGTKFSADSIILNNDTRLMQSFGRVHINDGDTVNIYSNYLSYNGLSKYSFLKNNVRLTGRNGTLTTQELDYNVNSGIANYYKGGRIVNNKNVITSRTGTYYSDTRDVFFKNNVQMDGPKDHIRADSLIYNMNDGGITFITDTYLRNDEVEIRTSEGRYDTNSGDAFFSARTNVKDSSGRIYTANNMALEGQSGNAQLEGNAIIIDSTNGFSLLANQVFLNNKENSFFATKKPVLIIQQKEDSTYIAADVIYSGIANIVGDELTYPSDTATQLNKQQSEKIADYLLDSANLRKPVPDTLQTDSAGPPPKTRELKETETITDTLHAGPAARRVTQDTLKVEIKPVDGRMVDSAQIRDQISRSPVSPERKIGDTIIPLAPADSLKTETGVEPTDTSGRQISPADTSAFPDQPVALTDSAKAKDTTRYFIAYHNVRIFNDSLQSVCDSLFISSRDSVFRLYRDPVVWSGETQVNGDTMFLFTKNKEAERLFVFERAMVVNRTKEGFFNQMAGKTLNAHFKENKFDFIRLKGSQSESIYFLQDDDSAYIGINRATGDVIDMIFENGELRTVKLINQIKGTMYPMGRMPEDQKFLKGFEWMDQRRPKNRAELFQ